MLRADCELWLDGSRVPDQDYQLVSGEPTALSGLVLTWGRNDSVSQPDTATCRFKLRDRWGNTDALGMVHVGMDVEVYSTGAIGGGGGDYYVPPGFSGLPLGALDPTRYQSDNAGAAPMVVAKPSGHAVQLSRSQSIWFPALPFNPGTPTAWDSLPRMRAGQTWAVEITARVPPGITAALSARTYTAPTQAGAEAPGIVTVNAPPIVGDLVQSTISGTISLPAGHADVWVALGITLSLPSPRAWQDATGVWTDHPEAWQDYGAAEVYRLQATVTGTPTRRVLVFAGSVTDAVSTPVSGHAALEVDVTAADITADLGSDVVGDVPWPMESVASRVSKIVGASKLHTPVNVDPALAPIRVSWRDVDAQPVYDLLADIAQTTGGVLWPSTHVTTGAYLWIEDPRDRAAVRTLQMVDGVVTVMAGGNPSMVDAISACDVLRDPVTLHQTLSEVTTTVSVSWREQTLDDQGLPSPTEHSVIVTDEAAYAQYGLRRMSVQTELVSAADATTLANALLSKSRKVTWRVSGYAIDTPNTLDEIPSVDNRTRMGVLMDLLDGTTRAGLPLTLLDLPPWLPNTAGGVYVEGGSYTFEDGWWFLDLTVTPGGSAGASARWQDTQPTGWRWNQMDPAITWSDLIGVGI